MSSGPVSYGPVQSPFSVALLFRVFTLESVWLVSVNSVVESVSLSRSVMEGHHGKSRFPGRKIAFVRYKQRNILLQDVFMA